MDAILDSAAILKDSEMLTDCFAHPSDKCAYLCWFSCLCHFNSGQKTGCSLRFIAIHALLLGGGQGHNHFLHHTCGS